MFAAVVFTRLVSWKERLEHVGKRACVEGGVVPLRTVGTVDSVDVPRLRLRKHVDYQKALHGLFAASILVKTKMRCL